MTDVPPDRATKIFLAVASLPPAERDALLSRECAGDLVLRRAVEELLANDHDDSFLAARTKGEAQASAQAETIGPYRILSRLGEGGMGEVFLAERRDLRQRVAIKLIKPGMDSRAILARFEAERAALARMEHSNIAKVLDAGVTPQGRPYFVMEYVKGIPITRYSDENKLPVEERLRLFQQVCSGVQHAHSKGVIHRDLTPNNVLVTVQDGKPTAKIIDFGLARATDHRLTERTVFTEQGVIMGTPEYMSPEQAGLGGLDIDTRTDVYTLGVMLYELLTGELPFSREELRVAGYEGMCRTIREKEPERPSTRITRSGTAKVAKLRRTEGERLLKRLRGDLDWVVLKCLEKDRTRRYETPTHLGDDLQRHLDDEVVTARAPSAGYRLKKLARRYRGQLLAAGAVLVTLVAGLVGMAAFWLESKEQARLAELRATESSKNATLLAHKIRDFDQLAGKIRLARVLEEEERLYPAWPQQIPAMRRWLEQEAGPLLAMRPQMRKTLDSLGLEGLPAAGGGPPAADSPAGRDDSREARRFLHETLSQLLVDLDAMESKQCRAVRDRLAWAERIHALTVEHPNARVTWAEAREAIAKADGVVASEQYLQHAIDLQPQMGLVPIGMNPVTKLWEFYELRSAWDGKEDPARIVIPEHLAAGDRAGDIEVGDDTGIVFVLLPGGTFAMGAQRDDPHGPNYDANARPGEVLLSVRLAPFFLARYEVTQAQWQRLASGANPSYYAFGVGGSLRDGSAPITGAHPVEKVDWRSADRWLARLGLAFPTEAQWEYGCRGGSATPWSCAPEKLCEHANLADAAGKRAMPAWDCEEWDDGHAIHAPVGSFRPNRFGLHDMHGNLAEWTRDGDSGHDSPPREGDGLRKETAVRGAATVRGGSYGEVALAARSAYKSFADMRNAAIEIGVRAARRLMP